MSDALALDGHCYCGAVRFAVRIPEGERPLFRAYCHCDSCRRAHAAPLYQVVCTAEEHYAIDEGAEHVVEFSKGEGAIIRAFCGRCGSKLYNRWTDWTLKGRTPRAWFPNLLTEPVQHAWPELLKPDRHFNADECVLLPEVLESVLQR